MPMQPVVGARTITLPWAAQWNVTTIAGRRVSSGFGSSIDIAALSTGGYILNWSCSHFRFVKSPAKNRRP
ncbi:MAG: hypothetical protein JXA71_02640 [Chitinispirillaceae bacterium]|nr:hypothetical protein [Chitinispirillaceae bacterium]